MTLYDQLDNTGRAVVATLYGAECGYAFDELLRSVPALPPGFTYGAAALACLSARMAYLSRTLPAAS